MEPRIIDAATLLLVRDAASTTPSILMGQRGANAAFMPNKFVFPGGAVDDGDHRINLAGQMPMPCAARLEENLPTGLAAAIVTAGIRELWEETGLILGHSADWQGDIPPEWQSYADAGYVPAADGIHFVFRAITPPGRTRRFDARFLLVDASKVANDPDDFSNASDELSNLQWVPIADTRHFDLPFITEVVLAEIAAQLPDIGPPAAVPFFNNSDEEALYERLGRSNID
jgi:8-oxo-dGTP pyrophosphatase MutT (NUDIX family)